MELCQCERYKEAVNNLKIFTVGTLHHLIPREEVPEHQCIKWTCNKTSHDELRFYKPILVNKRDQNVEGEGEKCKDEVFESKWIPVLPGLISQRLVNESKHLYSPF